MQKLKDVKYVCGRNKVRKTPNFGTKVVDRCLLKTLMLNLEYACLWSMRKKNLMKVKAKTRQTLKTKHVLDHSIRNKKSLPTHTSRFFLEKKKDAHDDTHLPVWDIRSSTNIFPGTTSSIVKVICMKHDPGIRANKLMKIPTLVSTTPLLKTCLLWLLLNW